MQKEGGEGKAVLSSVKCDVVEAVIIAGSEGRGLFGDFYRKDNLSSNSYSSRKFLRLVFTDLLLSIRRSPLSSWVNV